MFDTHAHINFSRFKKDIDGVIQRAHYAGVDQIAIPGTDIKSSKKAVEIAEQYEEVYATVGIHPHHAIQINNDKKSIKNTITSLESLISHPKVAAVGEIGMDRHEYEKTKYDDYKITDAFIEIQKKLFTAQIHLAIKHETSLIIHNREATDDLIYLLSENWDKKLEKKTVFHCCEPKDELLDFAKKHKIYIGVDGDVTYDTIKQKFINKVPLDMLVLETDSPFLLPEPLKSRREYPNEPKNVRFILEAVSEVTNISTIDIKDQTTNNANILFSINR